MTAICPCQLPLNSSRQRSWSRYGFCVAAGSWRGPQFLQTLLTLRTHSHSIFFPTLVYSECRDMQSACCGVVIQCQHPAPWCISGSGNQRNHFQALLQHFCFEKFLYYHLCWQKKGIMGVTASGLGYVILCLISASSTLKCKTRELQRPQQLGSPFSRLKSSSLRHMNCALKLWAIVCLSLRKSSWLKLTT